MTDFELMGAALEEARKAAALGEVPVGAVVAKDGEIISAAHNTRETEKNALHHAELLAIDAACKKLGGWRLWQCTSLACWLINDCGFPIMNIEMLSTTRSYR